MNRGILDEEWDNKSNPWSEDIERLEGKKCNRRLYKIIDELKQFSNLSYYKNLVKESIKINTKTKGSCISCEHRSYEEWQEYCTLTDRGEKCKYKQDSSELIRSVKDNIEEEFKEECKKIINEYIENNIDEEYVKYIPSMIKIWVM